LLQELLTSILSYRQEAKFLYSTKQLVKLLFYTCVSRPKSKLSYSEFRQVSWQIPRRWSFDSFADWQRL